MSGTSETLAGIFGMTDFLMPLVLADLSEAEVRRRSRGDDGPSIAWSVGHLMFYRCHVLGLLGIERANPYGPQYVKAGASDGADYPAVLEMVAEWDQLAGELREALGAATEEHLGGPAPDSGPHHEETVRDKVVFFAWHEGYHMGAIGALRKEMGLPGPAEKVMALREGS